MSELLVISRLTPLINFLWSSCVVLVKKNEKVENVTVNCLHSLSSHGDGDRSTSCYTNLTPALATLNFYANLRYIYMFSVRFSSSIIPLKLLVLQVGWQNSTINPAYLRIFLQVFLIAPDLERQNPGSPQTFFCFFSWLMSALVPFLQWVW